MVLDIASWICLLLGGAFSIISAIGLLRMPDVFTRMHAASIGDTMALGLMCVGMMLQAGLTIITIKLALILLFIFFVSPTTTHALAKAAIAGGVKPMLHEDKRKKPRKRKSSKKGTKTIRVRKGGKS